MLEGSVAHLPSKLLSPCLIPACPLPRCVGTQMSLHPTAGGHGDVLDIPLAGAEGGRASLQVRGAPRGVGGRMSQQWSPSLSLNARYVALALHYP
mgnify:CR=1 FL=1